LVGALLDTHSLYWAVSGEQPLSAEAKAFLGKSQTSSSVFISAVVAWELSLAARKRHNAPSFGNLSIDEWLQQARKQVFVRTIPITERIAIEAATVVTDTGHKDPGDGYIIATARVRNITIITRDAAILKIAASGYVKAIAC
jgi:PIN domain nuclease of toxin-antitoxin system